MPTANGDPLGSPQTPPSNTIVDQESASTVTRLAASLEALRSSIDRQTEQWDQVVSTMRIAAGLADDLGSSFEEAADSAEDVKKAAEGARAATEGVNKAAGGVRDSFKKTVEEADELRAKLRGVAIQIKRVEEGMGRKTFKETANEFERIKKAAEAMLPAAQNNVRESILLRRYIRECDEAQKDLNKNQADSNKLLKSNVDAFARAQGHAHNLQEDMRKITDLAGSAKIGKFSKTFANLAQIMGRSGGHIAQANRQIQNAHEAKQLVKERTGENKEKFADKRAEVEHRLRASSLAKDVFNEKGELDVTKFRQSKEARQIAADVFTQGPGGEKGGIIDRMMVSQILKGKGGLNSGLLEAGAGSAAEGLGLGAEGLATSGVLSMTGPIGIAASIGEVTKKFLDKTAELNQKTEAGLGKGGIFTAPGVHGGAALTNVRNNLMAWGGNGHNITTERRYAVAQAMQEEGAGLSELSTPSGFNPFGGNAKTAGEVGDIVMKQAREVGLTDVEGTKQVMKMLQNYKMTLNGTQDFFRTIGKDIHAAGISTTKYLQLIDDVTDHFGSMGKSIGAVTGLLRILGATGTSTYDQMKENTGALTDNKANLEQRSFLYATMSPADKKVLAEAQESNAKNATDAFTAQLDKAMTDMGMDKSKVLAGTDTTPEGMQRALSQFRLALPKDANTNVDTTLLEPLIQQAQAATINARAARSGNPVGMAAIQEITGKNEMGQVALQLQSFNQIMRAGGASFGQAVVSPTTAINANNSTQGALLSQALGFDPDKILHIANATSDATDQVYRMLHQGMKPGTFANGQEEENTYMDYLRKGGQSVGAGLTAKQTIQNMTDEQLGGLTQKAKAGTSMGDALKLLTDTNNPFNKALLADNKKTLAEQEGLTKEMASNTRTLDSWLKETNDNIIGWLGKPLAKLVDKIVGTQTIAGDIHNADVAYINDKTLNDNLDAARKLEMAAESYGTEVTDTVPDKEGNKRSLKELLTTQAQLAKQINAGDVTADTHKEFGVVNEDINNIVAHAQGKFGEEAIQPWFKTHTPLLTSLSPFLKYMQDNPGPPKVDQPGASTAANKVTPAATPGQGQGVVNIDKSVSITQNVGQNAGAPPPPSSGKASRENVMHKAGVVPIDSPSNLDYLHAHYPETR